jgi:hypothetical protein
MSYKYFVQRLTVEGSTYSLTNTAYTGNTIKDAKELALKAYYDLLGTAASSTNDTDTVMVLSNKGLPIRLKVFKHE